MSTKISALPASAGLVLTDIFPMVDDPGGSPVTQKATLSQIQTLFSSGSGAFVLKSGDTMTGSLTIANGTLTATTTILTGHVLGVLDALNASAPTALNLTHSVTAGLPSPGIGLNIDQSADTTTSLGVRMTRWATTWTDATHATRTAQTTFFAAVSGADSIQLILGNNVVQLGGAGTAALPSLVFRNDPDTGLFFNNANDMFISAGGVQVAAFTDTTGIILSTSLTLPYVAKAATYTASAVDYTIDCTSGTFDVDLPTAVGITGRIYVIKNSGVGTITIDPAGAELIDSLATATVVSGAAIMTQSTGTGWIII